MSNLVFTGLILLLMVACAGYTGWYFGYNEGFAKAKAQYSQQSVALSNYQFTAQKAKPTPHRNPLSSKTHLSSKTGTTAKPQPRTNTTHQLQGQVARMDRLIEKTARQNQQQSSQVYKVAKLREKNSACRWTVGRLGELQRIIKTGGKGRESQFCEEYKRRAKELTTQECQNRLSAYGGVC